MQDLGCRLKNMRFIPQSEESLAKHSQFGVWKEDLGCSDKMYQRTQDRRHRAGVRAGEGFISTKQGQ